MDNMKKCSKCNDAKKSSQFSKCAASQDGLKKQCKECIAIATKKYIEENKQIISQKKKLDYSKNRDERLKAHQVYRLNNLEKMRARDAIRDLLPERRFSKGKIAAKRRKLDWTISFEHFSELCKEKCYYCANKIGDRNKSTYAALDRIDNSRGYVIDNVLPSCSSCNYIRGDLLTVDETKKMIELLVEIRFGKVLPPVTQNLCPNGHEIYKCCMGCDYDCGK